LGRNKGTFVFDVLDILQFNLEYSTT